MSTRTVFSERISWNRGRWVSLAILIGVFLTSTATLKAQVRITELQVDPQGVNSGRQLVELRNFGDAAYDLTGHYLYFRPSDYRFPSGTVIPPQGILTIHLN